MLGQTLTLIIKTCFFSLDFSAWQLVSVRVNFYGKNFNKRVKKSNEIGVNNKQIKMPTVYTSLISRFFFANTHIQSLDQSKTRARLYLLYFIYISMTVFQLSAQFHKFKCQ